MKPPVCGTGSSGGNFLQELLLEPVQMEKTESSWGTWGGGGLTVLQIMSLNPEMHLDTPRNTQQSQGQRARMGTRQVFPDEDWLHLRTITPWGWQSPAQTPGKQP